MCGAWLSFYYLGAWTKCEFEHVALSHYHIVREFLKGAQPIPATCLHFSLGVGRGAQVQMLPVKSYGALCLCQLIPTTWL